MHHDNQTLAELIKEFLAEVPSHFSPHACYWRSADELHVYLADVPSALRRINRHVSIMVASGGAMAGVVVHDVKALQSTSARSASNRRTTVGTVVEQTINADVGSVWHLDSSRLSAFRSQEVCLS